ncbi:F-box domain containing protein [Tanacetum coccineum]|uniref:F-box domain containing protein n=1 Tax=Tanacetum coccineum TaxID=301880 RepID=A0ABQ5APJ3_9ASTR
MRHGFDLGYKTWVHHGEPDLPPPPPVIDNTRQPQMSDMTALLNDLSYIPPNNEHNEPTQGDIGETSNELTQATRNEFKELYASANEELYPGCDYVTRLDFMAKFTYFKVKGKLTDSIFNEMLEFFQNVFPISKGYKLPPSYYAIKKTFKMIGLGPLIEDLKVLWDRKGVESIDVASGQKFNMRAMVLWTNNDFPARSSLSGWSGQGYKACPTCNKDTPYVRVLSKTAYVGHKRFLKKPHKWRSSLEFNGQTDNRDPPKEFGWDEILAQLDRLPTRVKGHRQGKTSNCKGWAFEVACGSAKPKTGSALKASGWLSSLFKQICSATLMEDDMLKAQIKVVDILCDLELIYSPTFFDIMVHLVIHLPLEALEGGPIRPQWMFPFERYMKKLKGYVRITLSGRPEIDTYRSPVQSLFLTRHEEEFPDWLGLRGEAFKNDQYILVTQVKQLFYLEDKAKPHWKVVEHVNHKKFSNGGVIVVEDDPDIIHFDNSSDLPLSTSLNDLDNATLHIDGQSTEVDAPPDIIDVVDEDDDIIDDEDALPHDLADFDDEDLINVDDDGVDKMSADVARSHGGDGGGEDRPPPHYVPTGCGGCFANRGKGKRKPNLGGRAAGRLHTRDKTRNLSLKEITDKKGPVPIRFEVRDKQTLMPLGPEGAEGGAHYRYWGQLSFYVYFIIVPHMDSSRWTEIYEGINMHLQKAYNTNKASFKAKHWKADPTTGTYDVEAIRRARPEEITAAEWDKYIQFWNDPKNLARAAQNRLNRQKSVAISRQGSRSLARLRYEMRQASDTQEYPSLIDTFWRTHTVDGVFPKDEDRRIYVRGDERLKATGEYTEDEINALARRGKLRGHIPGVGRVLPSRATSRPSMSAPVDKSLKSMHRKVDFMMSIFRSDSKYSDMFKEFESGGASGSGGCGDDEESGDDEDDDGER